MIHFPFHPADKRDKMLAMKKNFYLHIWGMLVILAPLWWFLGFNIFIYHFFAFVLFLFLLHESTSKNRGLFLPPSVLILVALTVAYAFSILIHAGSAERVRLMASCYNLCYWGMGCMLVLVMANAFRISQLPWVRKCFLILGAEVGIFALVMFVLILFGVRVLVFPTPLYGLSGLVESASESLFDCTVRIVLLQIDWLASGAYPRMNFLTAYPPEAGNVIMLIMIMLLLPALRQKKSAHFLRGLIFVGCFGALLMTFARTAVTSLLIALLMMATLFRKKRVTLTVIGLLVCVVVFFPLIMQAVDWLLRLRKGSTEGRFSLYQYSLQLLDQSDWLLGMGYKPLADVAQHLTSGSHSSYLTIFFKIGFIGLILFFLLQFFILIRWWRLRPLVAEDPILMGFWRVLGGVFFGMLLCLTTADLDATQILAFFYFSIIGFFEAFAREIRAKSYAGETLGEAAEVAGKRLISP